MEQIDHARPRRFPPYPGYRDVDVPVISVSIPASNRELLIADIIESVLGQTSSDFELGVVDDSSTGYGDLELLQFPHQRPPPFVRLCHCLLHHWRLPGS